MGEVTAIEWTDSTFSPWHGCVKVSPACDFCYAEALAKRWGFDIWGKGSERRLLSDAHWNGPVKWNRAAEKAGVPHRVFCASMADVFEDHPDLPPQRERLWKLIEGTPWLRWQLLTKRPENVARMVPWIGGCWPPWVWLGITVEDPTRAKIRIPRAISAGAPLVYLSMEPLLGDIDLSPWISELGWIIAGGESGNKARPTHPAWARSIRDQAEAAGVPFLWKQWGHWVPYEEDDPPYLSSQHGDMIDGHLLPADLTESQPTHGWWWPGGPDDPVYRRAGKKGAGRMLDGRTWDGVPPL